MTITSSEYQCHKPNYELPIWDINMTKRKVNTPTKVVSSVADTDR